MTTTVKSGKSQVSSTSNVEIIKKNDLIGIVSSIRGVSFAHMTCETVPTIPKSNPYHGRVTKISSMNVIIGNWHYENSVNNQLERESLPRDFKPQPRKWGVRIDGTGLVSHQSKLYIEAKIEKFVKTIYTLDGNIMNDNDRDSFLSTITKKDSPSTQDSLDKKIILRDFKLDSVNELRINGKIYIVQK